MQELWSPFFELVRWPAVEIPGKGKGAEGCKRSHVTLAEQELRINTDRMVIVLEDDAVPTRKFKEMGLEVLAEARRRIDEWDYINCGPCLDPQFTGRQRIRISPAASPLFLWVDFSYRTHFVLYNRRSLPLLRAALESDTEIDLHLGHNARNQWVPRHVLAVQADGVSDIHKTPKESGSGYLTTEQMLTDSITKYALMNKPCIACYLPPSTSPDFIAALQQCRLPVLLYSEADYDIAIPVVKMKASPSVLGPGAQAITFFTACLLAQRNGYSHMIYLTTEQVDVDKLWADYTKAGKPHALAGAINMYHLHAMTGHAVKDARALKDVGAREYGGPSSSPPHRPAVYPTLAPAVYPLDMMDEMFKLADGKTVEKARKIPDIAHRIGELLWEMHGGAIFDYVVHMDLTAPLTTEAQTIQKQLAGVATIGEQPALTPEAGAVIHLDAETQAKVVAMVDTRLNQIKTEMTPMRFTEPAITYRTDIMLVTRAAEVEWLAQCLASIGEFCTGFGGIQLVFPAGDEGDILPAVKAVKLPFDAGISGFITVENKQPQQRTIQHCFADQHCPDADLVLHLDANCVFDKPTTPEDYFHAGKPVLLMTPYLELKEKDPARFLLKDQCELIMKEPVHYSTTERMPVIHWREAYAGMRGFVEIRQNMKFADYVLSEPFNGFAILGAFALRSRDLVERYHFENLSKQITKTKRKK